MKKQRSLRFEQAAATAKEAEPFVQPDASQSSHQPQLSKPTIGDGEGEPQIFDPNASEPPIPTPPMPGARGQQRNKESARRDSGLPNNDSGQNVDTGIPTDRAGVRKILQEKYAEPEVFDQDAYLASDGQEGRHMSGDPNARKPDLKFQPHHPGEDIYGRDPAQEGDGSKAPIEGQDDNSGKPAQVELQPEEKVFRDKDGNPIIPSETVLEGFTRLKSEKADLQSQIDALRSENADAAKYADLAREISEKERNFQEQIDETKKQLEDANRSLAKFDLTRTDQFKQKFDLPLENAISSVCKIAQGAEIPAERIAQAVNEWITSDFKSEDMDAISDEINGTAKALFGSGLNDIQSALAKREQAIAESDATSIQFAKEREAEMAKTADNARKIFPSAKATFSKVEDPSVISDEILVQMGIDVIRNEAAIHRNTEDTLSSPMTAEDQAEFAALQQRAICVYYPLMKAQSLKIRQLEEKISKMSSSVPRAGQHGQASTQAPHSNGQGDWRHNLSRRILAGEFRKNNRSS